METAPTTVEVERRGALGILTLRRPEALNALDLEMVRILTVALTGWASDETIRAVVLRGAGTRGFCAGGDVRGLHENIVGGRLGGVEDFFREEYALNALIARYPHPVIALAEGIAMGGGIGLAGHAAIRVVTERSQLAMPETRIGFTPDVGGSWLLAHAPGRVGEYLALTGGSVGAADAISIGLADHHVPGDALPALVEALEAAADPWDAVAAHATEPAPGRLPTDRPWIDASFAAEDVSGIVAALRGRPEEAARATADTIDSLSPTAVAVTLAAVRRARGLSRLEDALAQEFGLVMWFALTQPDLPEGIRAQLIDKDRTPRWQPADRTGLAPDTVSRAFAFRPATPLWD